MIHFEIVHQTFRMNEKSPISELQNAKINIDFSVVKFAETLCRVRC